MKVVPLLDIKINEYADNRIQPRVERKTTP